MSFIEHDPSEHALRAIEEKLHEKPRLFRPLAPGPAPVHEPEPVAPPEPTPEPPIMKIDHTLLPLDALDEISRALMVGKENHGAWGWREVPKAWTEYLAKAQRHIYSFQRGETIDPTTGLHHVSCAIANLMFLQSHVLTGSGLDDRFKR
jgi:hypothetical protein